MRHHNIKILNLFDPGLLLINSKLAIKHNLKDLLDELKKPKDQKVLVLEYKKIYDHESMCKITHSGG